MMKVADGVSFETMINNSFKETDEGYELSDEEFNNYICIERNSGKVLFHGFIPIILGWLAAGYIYEI